MDLRDHRSSMQEILDKYQAPPLLPRPPDQHGDPSEERVRLELEIRFLHINRQQYFNLSARLSQLAAIGAPQQLHYIREESRVDIASLPQRGSCFRWISRGSDAPVAFERKDIVETTRIDPWNLSLQLSREVVERTAPTELRPSVSRHRVRESYTALDRASPLHGFRVDLTVVTTVTDAGASRVSHEVELEVLRATNSSAVALETAVLMIYCWLHSVPRAGYLLSAARQHEALSRLVHLLQGSVPQHDSKRLRLPISVLNQPRSVTSGSAPATSPSVFTVKYDGVRALLFITVTDVLLYLFSNDVLHLGASAPILATCPDAAETILDGEWMVTDEDPAVVQFHSFDLLYYGGRDQRDFNFATRRELLNQIPEIDYHRRKMYHTSLAAAFEEYDMLTRVVEPESLDDPRKRLRCGHSPAADGIILQPLNERYQNSATFKWKPPEQMTIDFMLARTDDPDTFELRVMSADDHGQQRFLGNSDHPCAGSLRISGGRFLGESVSGRIVECRCSSPNPCPASTGSTVAVPFVPVRYRSDRKHPNSFDVALAIYESVLGPIAPEELIRCFSSAGDSKGNSEPAT